MKGMAKGVILGCFLGLISCAPMPVTQIPQIPANNLGQLAWWNKFHDPILNQLLHQALENNNQILEAKAKTLQAQAQLKAAYASWLPTLSVSANGIAGQGWDSRITPEGVLAANSGLAQANSIRMNGGYAGFMPNYSLNLLETINNTRWAKASLAMQEATYHAMKLSIISQTVGAYFSLVGQKEQAKLQKRYIAHLNALHELEQVRYTDGASDRTLITELEQELADNEAKYASLEYSVVQTQNALQLLINHDPGPIITHRAVNQLNTKNIIPPGISARVLKNRPDLMIAQERLNKAHALVGLSYSALFPKISLTGLLGGASLDLTHLLKLTTGLGAAQLAAQMSLFNIPVYHHIQESKAEVKAAWYYYMHTLRAALGDVETSLTHYKKNHEAYMKQLKGYQATERLYSLALARYQSGVQDKRSLLKAQLKVDKAQISLVTIKMEELSAVVLVYQALAGGYLINDNNSI